jgi:hypothetical protein
MVPPCAFSAYLAGTGMPVISDAYLGIGQGHFASTHPFHQRDFELVLSSGAVRPSPGLQHQIGEFAGVATDGKIDKVIQLVTFSSVCGQAFAS